MKSPGVPESRGGREPKVPPNVAAEAAVWIARLHGPSRSEAMERECLAWQAQSALHRLAFERCTDVWEEVRGVRLADAYRSAKASDPDDKEGPGSGRSRWLLMSMAVMLIAAAAFAIHHWRNADVYATKVGELQLVVLDDGTRMSLNTNTQVRVDFDADRRSVNVQGGEVLFEVAKDPRRPFVVRMGDSEVVAVGTVFSVRFAGSGERVRDALAVTLIEGQVTVRAASANAAHGIAPVQPMQMRPGERVRLVKSSMKSDEPAAPQVDRPRIDQLVAWTRSEAIFEDVSLRDAVAEMNRYNRTPIVLLDEAALSRLRVSGLYRTGDSAGFARAVATLHGLAVHERGGRMELASPQ